MPKTAIGTVGFVSLGCAKNLIDSETMLGRLAGEGFIITGDHENADVVIVNTCGFLEASRDESLATIREVVERKAEGRVQRVVVAGCMVGNYREMLAEQVPQVDAMLSVNDREQLAGVLKELRSSGDLQRSTRISDPDERGTVYDDRGRLRLTPRHYAYLRISEGCDHTCSFCIIPSIRGRHRSKSPDQILMEAREMVDDGAKELVLIAQDTTYYGVDRNGEKQLAQLLAQLSAAVGPEVWLRVMYAYPNQVTDELVDTMAAHHNILPYIDMPLQHINTNVLKRMRRGGSRELIENWITRWRQAMPDFVLRTTFIAGFPGETEAEHQELVQWIRDGWVDRLGCFAYSPEKDSHSFGLEGHLPDAVRLRRHEEVMMAAQEALFAANAKRVGTVAEVLVDGLSDDPKYPLMARTKADAPDVDCAVMVAPSGFKEGDEVAELVGSKLTVKLVKSLGYDLLATGI